MLALAASLSPELVDWISDSVSFPSSSVDRITPQIAEDELRELIVTTGDEAPVVAEPFSDWVVSGAFPGGRPQWETAGARFVDDLEPWEARKLWMLNGAHTLLACLGLLRGHRTVAESIGDPVCRAAVESLWNEDAACLPACLGLDEYRQALVDRFANARIEHRLEQIAADSFMKLRLRVVPVTEVLLRRGELPRAGAAAIAAWIVAARRGLLPPEATAPSAHSGAALSSLLTRLSDVVGASAPFADEVESIRVSYEEV
nr:hypothetical protein [Herbiconiux ginsengi]